MSEKSTMERLYTAAHTLPDELAPQKEETELERWHRRYVKSHEIRCPHCGYLLEDEETHDHISYHGYPDEEDQAVDCPGCEKTFVVREQVDRTWEVRKPEESFDD